MTIIITGYHDYLEKRGIVLKSVLADQLAGVLRSYRYGNACFPYFDFGVIASIERRNANFKCYKKVGINRLWRLKLMERDERPVICDVPIDALSYTRLRYDPTDQTRYFASGVQFSRSQWELLNALMQKYGSQKIEIILAFDNDLLGKAYIWEFQSRYPELESMLDLPSHQGKGRNDGLQNGLSATTTADKSFQVSRRGQVL